jgi:hypothetical protein
MERIPFHPYEIHVLQQAMEISEEVISDFYKISTSEWKRYRYDIQTLKDLQEEEITDSSFAQILRYARSPYQRSRGSEPGDFFKICLQDHVIRHALQRDPHIQFLPLSTYIVTHELIHVVRFAKFLQPFHTTESNQDAEEKRVHALTHRMLERRRIQGLSEVFVAFKDFCTLENLFVISEKGNA